ncbi:MAG: CehA/McbA family metallohydrolase [Gemmatimonadetes bacterium]|nr:CehA/McbA family metallohydrolase [Gemmatimonadota bacterium]
MRSPSILRLGLAAGLGATLGAAHEVPLPPGYQYQGRLSAGGGMYLESLYLPPVTTGPWAPAWSPDGREIVVAMHGSLWRVPAEGGEAQQITAGPHYDSEPSWSPAGRRIAFTRDTGQQIDVWVVNADGSDPRQLTQSEAFSVNPEWSPVGDRILYVSLEESRPLGVWSISPSGGAPQPILVDEYQNITPSWSPDGSQVVFVSNRFWNGRRVQGTGGLWTYRLGDPEPTILVPEETVWHAYPAWSPDGTKIAYGSFRSGDNQLYVVSATQGNPYRVTHVDGEIYVPAWSPDGRTLAYVSNAGSQFRLYTVSVYGGTPKEVEITALKHRYPIGRLQLTVRDAASGSTTGARVYVRASDGKGYTPRGEFHRMWRTAPDGHYFHTTGSSTLEVPAGRVTVEALKGFEYRPVTAEVNVVAGETRELELTLERLIDLPALGWYSGDNHIHMNYGGLFDATPRTLLLEAEAEDLNVVNDMIANQSGLRIHDLKYFEGKLHALSRPNRLLYFNEEYRPSFSGHMSLLNLKKFFFPQFDGMVGTALSAHYPSNSYVLDAVHAQGGVGGYVHPFYGEPSLREYGDAREFPVSAALGNTDYIDIMCVWSDELHSQKVWYRNLNLGLGVPASAGSDAMTDYWRHPSVGAVRVYVKTGSPLDYGNWIRGLTEGRSFVTSGPLLFLRVDGREPGAEIRLPGGTPTTVRVEAEATSIFAMDALDIIQDGEVVHSVPLTDPHHVKLDITLPVERTGWLAARVLGRGQQRYHMDAYVYAHTNPVYLNKGGEPPSSPEDAQYFLTWIDTVIGMLESQNRFDTPEQRREVLAVWRQARAVYAGLAREATRAGAGAEGGAH